MGCFNDSNPCNCLCCDEAYRHEQFVCAASYVEFGEHIKIEENRQSLAQVPVLLTGAPVGGKLVLRRRGGKKTGRRRVKLQAKHLIFQELIRVREAIYRLPQYSTFYAPQRYMVNLFLACALHLIVGIEDFRENQAYYLAFLSIAKVSSYVLIEASRQVGKTIALAITIACAMSCSDALNIHIFATNQDQARLILIQALRIYDELPSQYKRATIRRTTTEFELGDQKGSYTKIVVGSSNVNGNRGITPHWIINDEMAFMNWELISKTQLALMTVEYRVLTGITTPGAPDSQVSDYMARMQEQAAKGQGDVIFLKYSLICDTCIKDGIAYECRHKLADFPPWRSLDVVTAMINQYGTGNRHAMLAEIFGYQQSGGNRVFNPEAVEWTFCTRNRVRGIFTRHKYLYFGKSGEGDCRLLVDPRRPALLNRFWPVRLASGSSVLFLRFALAHRFCPPNFVLYFSERRRLSNIAMSVSSTSSSCSCQMHT